MRNYGIAFRTGLILLSVLLTPLSCWGVEHPEFSGVHARLAFFNDEDECGTGAVVQGSCRILT